LMGTEDRAIDGPTAFATFDAMLTTGAIANQPLFTVTGTKVTHLQQYPSRAAALRGNDPLEDAAIDAVRTGDRRATELLDHERGGHGRRILPGAFRSPGRSVEVGIPGRRSARSIDRRATPTPAAPTTMAVRYRSRNDGW